MSAASARKRPAVSDGTDAPRARDAERSKRAILTAALEEFSELGYAGARIDAIARRAGISKPMIYSYFGDKDEIYAAALREAYVQIRAGERELDLQGKSPEDAIRALVRFTMDHFRSKPWFISLLNTENLRGGTTIRQIADLSEIQSPLIALLEGILERGARDGTFRKGVDALEIYIAIASLCYFPVSNAHTLGAVFRRPAEATWLDRCEKNAEDLIIGFLQDDGRRG